MHVGKSHHMGCVKKTENWILEENIPVEDADVYHHKCVIFINESVSDVDTKAIKKFVNSKAYHMSPPAPAVTETDVEILRIAFDKRNAGIKGGITLKHVLAEHGEWDEEDIKAYMAIMHKEKKILSHSKKHHGYHISHEGFLALGFDEGAPPIGTPLDLDAVCWKKE